MKSLFLKNTKWVDQNHVERINQISDTNNHDIVSPLEGITLQNPNIQGGSRFNASTLADLGLSQQTEQHI